MEERLVLVVIDGLGYETAIRHCGFLESLVQGGKARRWKMRAVLPTLSLPIYETLHSGVDPHEHGIVTNDHRRLSTSRHTFGEVRAAGGRTGAVAHMNFSEIFNGGPYDPLSDHEYDDEARTVRLPAPLRAKAVEHDLALAVADFQRGDLALGPATLDATLDQGGDARRVIAAIFEPLEALDQPGDRRSGAGDANDAAHRFVPYQRSSENHGFTHRPVTV